MRLRQTFLLPVVVLGLAGYLRADWKILRDDLLSISNRAPARAVKDIIRSTHLIPRAHSVRKDELDANLKPDEGRELVSAIEHVFQVVESGLKSLAAEETNERVKKGLPKLKNVLTVLQSLAQDINKKINIADSAIITDAVKSVDSFAEKSSSKVPAWVWIVAGVGAAVAIGAGVFLWMRKPEQVPSI